MITNKNEASEEIQALPVYSGQPGVMREERGYRFTVSAPEGQEVFLLLYKKGEYEPIKEILLSGEKRLGNLLSVCVNGISPDKFEYNYRIEGKVVPDPYAMYLSGAEEFGSGEYIRHPHKVRCGFRKEKYRWSDEGFRPLPLSDTILYKLQVREYTMHKKSGVRRKGTFAGLEQKIGYLKELGVTSVLLMPAYDYKEVEDNRRKDKIPDYRDVPGTGAKKAACEYPEGAYEYREDGPVRVNCWGYTGDACYFAPKGAFAGTDHPVREFRHLVDTMHQAGLECLMEFYFDGTVSPSMMLDILHWWKKEYHVDGFRLIGEGICQEVFVHDSVLARTKLFFHDVDGGFLYRGKVPVFKNTAEYNEGFLYCMRHLLKSDENMMEEFIYRNKRNTRETGIINYLADQDGFTMMDMVSYDEKHNEANGENNQDGMDYNCCWNCGTEGPTRKRTVKELRLRQLKNAFLLLLLSQGTPLIFQGDEFGNSQQGNNNAWCQDNEIGWIDWGAYRNNQELLSFVREAIALRKSYSILHMEEELKGVDYRALGYPDLSYHGAQAWYAPCERNLRHIGMMYCGDYGEHSREFLFVAYNLHWTVHEFALPNLPDGIKWSLVASTGCPGETIAVEEEQVISGKKGRKGQNRKRAVNVPPRTIAILIGKQETK